MKFGESLLLPEPVFFTVKVGIIILTVRVILMVIMVNVKLPLNTTYEFLSFNLQEDLDLSYARPRTLHYYIILILSL